MSDTVEAIANIASGAWHVIETNKPEQRDQLVDFLVKNNIDAKTHYSIAIHKQEGYPWGKGARIAGSVANAERNAATCVIVQLAVLREARVVVDLEVEVDADPLEEVVVERDEADFDRHLQVLQAVR